MKLSSYRETNLPSMSIKIKYAIWLLISNLFFLTNIPYPNKIKILFLKAFGAKIGKKSIIKPWVKIKFPWELEIGDDVWLGENVWIDNISKVSIGNNVCISQNTFILTGNHNYRKETFDLITLPIIIEDNVWITANCLIANGVTIGKNSLILLSSTVISSTEENGVYRGNPAIKIKNKL
ncbi:colanic acid biosynthesis acetyltransferase WcaF [Sandaracinomonas limnophila]|uniref:Colanic acid biosynthesis acetyltransferase WcaF n=1 Tax=Sandaracinomonas limnophila TaxID=1862386 RepID=A0A437PWW9_9BACT|nr:WcaF family extracellular polysaccharide biosynthesis acetyltransferase [Sandaracinomonas limnophila]RVU26708.1 colanic acid biosynthesis acetyltransferase WcaF [Sandaracinomonas limnophila]